MSSYELPFRPGYRIIELGGGDKPLSIDGLTVFNVDIRSLPSVDAVRNLEEDFSDLGEFDGLIARYVTEHISWRKIQQFFKSSFNVLKNGATAVFIIPNTLEQFRKVVDKGELSLDDSQFIFGDQNYGDNSHKVAFSKNLVTELLKEAGFGKVTIKDVPDPKARDIIVEARKTPDKTEIMNLPASERYSREYFEDGTTGYVGYWDFLTHYRMVKQILNRKPSNVLDVGGARGYIVKKLEAHNIPATCMDASLHAWHTRATDNYVLHDATQTPWPFKDKEFDLLTSFSFLEHIEGEHIESVIREMARVSKRCYHTITFEETDYDIDATHCSFMPHEKWMEMFKKYAPDYPVEIMTVEEAKELEPVPVEIPRGDGLNKINFGSFNVMFHYGWLNVDILDLSKFASNNAYSFQQHDVRNNMPMNDSSIDCVIAHHLIEHLPRDVGLNFLKECHRIMRLGAVIRLSCPDAKLISKVYSKGGLIQAFKYVNVGVEKSKTESEAFHHLLLAGHEIIYDGESLKRLMEDAGFIDVKVSEFNKSRSDAIRIQTIDSSPTLSVYVEGVKSDGSVGPKITVEPELQSYQKYLKDVIKEGTQ